LSAAHREARFPRSRRLLRGTQFKRVFDRPERCADACFAIAARRSQSDAPFGGTARLGLAISRKALPHAVDRNRIKRIVREAFRLRRWPCSVDLVVVGRAGLRRAANAEVRQSVEAHFDRIRQRLCGTASAHVPER
jgi:ribonuclease P protein component